MPFASTDSPNLAAGLLKALLQERGIPCDCKYFNLIFSSLLGEERYRRLVGLSRAPVLAGEWMFSQAYFGESFSSWERYRSEVLSNPVWGIETEYQDLVQELRDLVPTFLRIAYEACDWSDYDLVGFTSTFEQTMPCMCLAKMIRRGHPGIKIAVGGANFEGPMGRPYLDLFPEIDFVSTGEADVSFPQLCENLSQGIDSIPAGILSRNLETWPGSGAQASTPTAPISLDTLPFPDYGEYFQAFARTFPRSSPVGLPLQASRGCWWGQKHHCTFCGLNGETMAFRRKSWERVAQETAEMETRYRPASLVFADNILAMDYFPTLLPHWANGASATPKFFEIKANLKREHVLALKRASILFIQSGIESLSDRTLELMDKGVSVAQNIALLRWCQELGLNALWNLIFGFPGEDLDDYPRMHDLMQKLTHLNAPEACAPIRMDRFSPNFERWQEHGFLEVRPLPSYAHVYPLGDDGLRQLAYYFEYRHAHSDQVLGLARDLLDFGTRWRQRCERKENGTLAVRQMEAGWVLVDSRFNRPQAAHRMTPEDLLVLRLCDGPTTRDALLEKAVNLSGASRQKVSEAYEALLEKDAVCEVGQKIVALPFLPDDLRESAIYPKKGASN
jgi:ribosomal peptide maturation radical SAM protein 1